MPPGQVVSQRALAGYVWTVDADDESFAGAASSKTAPATRSAQRSQHSIVWLCRGHVSGSSGLAADEDAHVGGGSERRCGAE
jgi:hypothetical protein